MKVPPGWEEIPVSIADPKGTEVRAVLALLVLELF